LKNFLDLVVGDPQEVEYKQVLIFVMTYHLASWKLPLVPKPISILKKWKRARLVTAVHVNPAHILKPAGSAAVQDSYLEVRAFLPSEPHVPTVGEAGKPYRNHAPTVGEADTLWSIKKSL
jgi:hypothetical protein